VQGQAGAHL
jgi:hypothetical protein